jgi:RNA recognition motif-containing protein
METVFVGNLSYFCTKQALADFFAPLGPVRDINIRLTNRKLPLHYGFVEMSSDMAKIACEEWNNKVLLGRKIRYAPS